jgi:ABC-type glycerol-3-phosphate transport system substrate-binding protein
MRTSATALVLLCLALGLAACGGGGDSSGNSSASEGDNPEATTTIRGPQPPKGASALQREIHRTFQPPQADPKVEGSAQAIEDGEAACEGKTPVEVKEEFIGESDLSSDQQEALEQLGRAEANPSGDFAAGQLAALVYQQTLEGTEAEYGYRGCVYALARGLESRLGG